VPLGVTSIRQAWSHTWSTPDPWLDSAMEAPPPGWVTAGLAGAVGVALVALATFLGDYRRVDSPALLGALLFLAALAGALRFKRKLPQSVFAAWTIAAIAVLSLLGGPLGLYDREARTQTALMMLVWLVGETAGTGSRRLVGFVTASSLGIAIGREFTDPNFNAAGAWGTGMIAALFAGLIIRALILGIVNEKIAQEARAEQATTAERQRIAREVHDVIAHSMTVTMLHLSAARLAVARGDNGAATEALEEAEKAGRTSLNEIRHTVGLLRVDGAPDNAPQPRGVDVPSLVDGFRAAGMDVVLRVDADLETVEATTGLALYRIVQESLTNASKHAPGGRSTVRINGGHPLTVDIQTNGCGPHVLRDSGMGLVGMAERAVALGGSCEAGPHKNGWRVAATLP
jgi:signal transduction histidine kinase